jgi:hypothetical protein
MRHASLLASILVLVATAAGASSVQESVLSHERLRLKNTFKSPEEVVSYYCARDASGFVWSGLLDAERRAFTFWNDVPQQDSFFIARKYEVSPSQPVGHAKDHAIVEVRYEIVGVADAHGTRMPSAEPEHTVTFDLKRVGGVWKIVKPAPGEIAPVVLESKFPTAPISS